MSKFKCSRCNRVLDHVINRSYFWFDISGIALMLLTWDKMPFMFFMGCCYWVHRIWNYKFSKNIEAICPYCNSVVRVPPEQQKKFNGLKRGKFLD